MNALLKPSETDDADAIAAAYLYAARGGIHALLYPKPSRMQSSRLKNYAAA